MFYDYTGIGNPENLTDPDTPSGPFIITFAPGETEVEVTVDIRNDLVDEPDENYSVLLSNVEGPATLGVSSVTTTIIDDDENQGPDAVNDAFSTDFETDVGGNVLPNDSDPENDPLTVTTTGILTTANGGAATIDAAGNFTYSPPPVFRCDTFVYTITDGNGNGGGCGYYGCSPANEALMLSMTSPPPMSATLLSLACCPMIPTLTVMPLVLSAPRHSAIRRQVHWSTTATARLPSPRIPLTTVPR